MKEDVKLQTYFNKKIIKAIKQNNGQPSLITHILKVIFQSIYLRT
jgi:hypothetical protein